MSLKKTHTIFLFMCLVVPAIAFSIDFDFSTSFLSKIEKKYGDYAKRRMVAWQKIMEENQDKTDREKLEIVNRFFNLIAFRSDQSHWGKRDYWATPVEFLATNGGDCEDYSIAKYYTLRELGIPDDKLQLTYARALAYQQAHMVLTYYATPDAEPLVLDNINKNILPASKRKDLLPIYSFNGEGLWKAQERGRGKRVGSSERINLWRDVLKRLARESRGGTQ